MPSTRPRRTRSPSRTVTRPAPLGSSATRPPNHRESSSLSVRARHTSAGGAGRKTVRSIIGSHATSWLHMFWPLRYRATERLHPTTKGGRRARFHRDRAELLGRAVLLHRL